jgi:metal-sulfur cluster biosynthetic enzyme
VPGVSDVSIDLVWEPPWDPSKMSDAARLQLGMI